MTSPNVSAQSNTLKKIQKAFEKNGGQRLKDSKQLLTAKWLTPGTNFTELFLGKTGPLSLAEWLGDAPAGFSANEPKIIKQDEFVGVSIVYVSPTRTNLQLKVLVPHPKYRSLEQMGLVQQFAELKPPVLKVLSSRDLVIHGLPATQYEHLEGGCSLVVQLALQVVIQAKTPVCRNVSELSTLLEGLDVRRVESKVQS